MDSATEMENTFSKEGFFELENKEDYQTALKRYFKISILYFLS